jgi:uncharacterized protein (DUF433 family)
MTWQDFITTDTSLLAGKPLFRGTRLAADFVLGLFAAGWTQAQVSSSYPQLTPEALRAVFAYAAEVTRKVSLVGLNPSPISSPELLQRITIRPEQCGGRPCIRGMRIRVIDVLELLAAGESKEQILEDFPDLEADDIAACLLYAARRLDHPNVAA